MGFKFGKCKKLESIWSNAFENTDPDFIDFEGCDSLIRIGNQTEFEQLSGTSEKSFYGCDNLKHVSFKNCHNLQCIGRFSFAPTDNVTGSLESVDFTGCDGLRMLCAHCFIPSDTIYHHPNLTSIDISPCINLEFIDSYFMDHIAGLKEFRMENLTHLTRIGSYCASECPELEAIYASGCSAVESIATFAQCDKKLTHADLTGWDSLKTLGTYAFQQCSILETIIGWDDLKTHLETIGSSSFESDTQLNIDISNMPALQIIKNSAFKGDIAMKTCPNNCPSLETIDGSAFYNCTNLGLNDDGTHSTLDLHNNTNLTTIGDSAFEGVKAIETINLDNDTSLASLGNKCFYGNTELKHFYARNCTSLTSIGSNTFQGSTNFLDAWFTDCTSLSTIGDECFYGLTKMLYCDLPEDVITKLGISCFQNAGSAGIATATTYEQWKTNITNAQVAAGLINAGDEYLKSTFKSNACTWIDKSCFASNRLFEEVDCDDSPIAYGDAGHNAIFKESYVHKLHFKNCAALKYIPVNFASLCPILEVAEFDNSYLINIGKDAFSYDHLLKSFTCDFTNLTNLSENCFLNTDRVDGIALDWTMSSAVVLGKNAFNQSTLIKSITVDGGTATEVGASFAAFAPNLETVKITNMHSMTSINNEAFIQCPKLQSADFSGCDALATIGSKAFQIDNQMTECKLQDSPLTTLGFCCFQNCHRLENFDADSSNIKTIGNQAFEYCTSFKTFKIHQDDTQAVTYGNSAFAGWRNAASGLTPPTYPLDVYIYGSTPGDVAGDAQWGFVNGMNNNGCQVTIHFNADAENDYKTIAKHKEDVAHAKTIINEQTGKDVVWYWCCSNGQATATTGGTTPVEGNFQCAGWYATSIATTPTVVFDL